MRVEIQLEQQASLDLHKQQGEPEKGDLHNPSEVSQLLREVKKLGLKLEPVHPLQTHPLLTPYFMVDVPDRQTAERVIEKLSKNQIVEAAYLHPEESAP